MPGPGRKPIPPARIGLFAIAGIVVLYFIITGVVGLVQGG
jgi:hypothetical protein